MERVHTNETRVEAHYSQASPHDLAGAILAGLGEQVPSVENLAPADEFHIRGLAATQEMAARLKLTPATRVLDVGSGLGGPARWLAATYGCQVTGIDLTAAFCAAAEALSARLGLSERVTFRHGSALEMPFEDEAFDVAWTQHAAMNIADKAGLYREIARVMKPGGRLALFDIMKGPGGAVLFPVPWARVPEISFLVPPEQVRAWLEEAGLTVEHWQERTAEGLQFMYEKAAETNPPPSFNVFLGDALPQMMGNVTQSLEEGRIVVYEAIARK
jgi:MPBQ/MSBQ methyltransferase